MARHHEAVAWLRRVAWPCVAASRCAWWQRHITALPGSILCSLSQWARWEYRHAKAARGCRVVYVAVVALARYGHPLRFYITPHCPQCPPVAALKLRLVPVTASRPSGEGNRRYAKWPSLESVAQPSALPGRIRALRAAVCAPLWLSWHLGLGQALRAVCLVSGLRPVMWCMPPPTLVLRRCAASALRAGLPVRPPWGLPQPARLCYRVLLQVW